MPYSVRLRASLIPVLLLFFVPSCSSFAEEDLPPAESMDLAMATLPGLEGWDGAPALLQMFETPGSEFLALVGTVKDLLEGGPYTGPLANIVVDRNGRPLTALLTEARRSSYIVYSDDRYFAINSMVPNSIIPTITVFDTQTKRLQTYDTTTVFLTDFIIFEGQLYHSGEKSDPTLWRFDLETGEHFPYSGFYAQGPRLQVHDQTVYAVTRDSTYQVQLDSVTPTESPPDSAEKATEWLGRSYQDAIVFDSWEELLEHLRERIDT